ncbi:coproporphyrinogen-III oxidase family protein [Huintestinicola sp.]|uniref:coproporphyrinogen-III oxidase family protein n=1 Tax=Huintestinicola sp. TaxID=2981661 RepID=UPI003D7EC3A2
MTSNERKKQLILHAEEVFSKVKEYQDMGLICKDGDFVPSVHYPPITRYPDTNADECLKDFEYPADGFMDVYVHIPFCIRHCLFCHYPGKTGECRDEKEKYVSYLIREIDLYLKRFNIEKLKPRSILLGGGTPTYLPPQLFDHLLEELGKRMDMSCCKQYNVDHDPNSIIGEEGEQRLKIMKKHGITRLTIGIQSLDDDVLKVMNRSHNAEQAEEAVRKAVEYGFDVNIEFIYGHPGETIDNWIEVMDRAVRLPVGEIQIYRLKVQAYGDRQGKINTYEGGRQGTAIPDFKTTMMMKQIAIDILNENGYHETLRRVYAKDKRVFSHYAYNQCCNMYDQVGFGLTGFSSYHDRFDINSQYFDEYYSKIDSGELPITRGCRRSREEQIRQAIILPLKNRSVIKSDFLRKTGVNFDDVFQKKTETLKKYGLIEDNGKVVKLTEIGGFLADEVCEQYNSNMYKPFPRENFADGPLNPYLDNELSE